MTLSYDKQTVNSFNPLARYAHRNRIRKPAELALSRLMGGVALDYGCGAGSFIAEILAVRPDCAVGYEPFMTERACTGLPIYSKLEEVCKRGPFSLVTLFETIEHLSEDEIAEFFATCDQVLSPSGGILASAPIEIGPAMLAKELNRCLRYLRRPEHRPIELVKASIFGIAASRAENIKVSHKGFDFRSAVALVQKLGWMVEILHYGPLPIGTWYGNSQLYLWLTRQSSGIGPPGANFNS